MKTVRIYLFALMLASVAFAQEGSHEKSHYFGGRFAWGIGYVWNNEPVKGSFGSAKDGISESPLGNSAGMEVNFGVSYMYRLNGFVGFVGEAEFRMSELRLEEDVYSLPPKEAYGDETNFILTVYGVSFPVMVRVMPLSGYYLEAGAQFNLNIDGDITPTSVDYDDSYDFDEESIGWSLVVGGGFSLGWHFFIGTRLVMDMTRIEKDGIVEMTKGAAYREASPMKLWNLQFSFAGYFLCN